MDVLVGRPEKASNLGYLGPYRLSEPSSGNQIMEHPKDSMSKVKPSTCRIGAVIVGNTMLLSLFERTREFGLLRAVGWTRRRTVGLLLSESLLLAFAGAAVGVALSFVVVPPCSARLPALKGISASRTSPRAPSGAHLITASCHDLLRAPSTRQPALRCCLRSRLSAMSEQATCGRDE